jgi:cytidine deaminase
MKQETFTTQYTVCTFDELSLPYQHLITMAKEQTQKSYSPYSHFAVGAAVLLDNGEVFAGSNQENAAYPSGLCAERTAMFFANAQYPHTPAQALAIAAFTNGDFTDEPTAPCGACRQVLLETESRFGQNIEILLYGKEGIYCIDSVRSLLPLCFTKENLG